MGSYLEGVIFDYDGPIAKSFIRQFNWFGYWAKLNNKKFPFDNVLDFEKFYNDIVNESKYQDVYRELDLPCDEDATPSRVWTAYNDYKEKNPATYHPGIVKLIKDLHNMFDLQENGLSRRTRIGINTTNSWKSIRKELKMNGILGKIDTRTCIEDLRAYYGPNEDGANNGDTIKKPSKIHVDLTLNAMNVNGYNTIFITDTRTDLRAGTNIIRGGNINNIQSMKVVGTPWGYESEEDLRKGTMLDGERIYFDFIPRNPKEIKEYIQYQYKLN